MWTGRGKDQGGIDTVKGVSMMSDWRLDADIDEGDDDDHDELNLLALDCLADRSCVAG